MSNVFVTYNQGSDFEESTALRLQTLSNLYGLNLMLPYRYANAITIHRESKKRIDNADFVVAFCTDGLLSALLTEELNYAAQKQKRTILIFDKAQKRKIKYTNDGTVKEIYVDFYKTDEALHTIAEFLRNNQAVRNKKQQAQNNAVGVALLGIGLGLLAAWVLSKNDQ